MSERRLKWVSCRWWSAASLAVGVGLTGCSGGDQSELDEYVSKVKARKPAPLAPLPKIKQVETFIYEPGDRRDPFVADIRPDEPAVAPRGNGLAPDPGRRKEELEGVALDSLRMVGTLERDLTRWGLIRAQDGTLHMVRAGNYVGLNNGRITSISEDEIHLTEVVSENPGDWRERQAKISLTE